MDLAIIGAGHVGTVCGACLAALGHDVTVMDIDQPRVSARLIYMSVGRGSTVPERPTPSLETAHLALHP